MGDFAQMHVFFVVTTIAVVLVALLVCIALYFVVRILRTVDRFSEEALDEAKLMRGDIAELRGSVKREGAKLKHFAKFGKKFAARFKKEDVTT